MTKVKSIHPFSFRLKKYKYLNKILANRTICSGHNICQHTKLIYVGNKQWLMEIGGAAPNSSNPCPTSNAVDPTAISFWSTHALDHCRPLKRQPINHSSSACSMATSLRPRVHITATVIPGFVFDQKKLTFRFLNLESGKPKNRTGKCVPDSSGNGKFSRKPDFPSGIVNPGADHWSNHFGN